MKELDKDALLEEAKRRYPVGTKFKSALRGNKHPFQTIVNGNIYLDKVEGRQVIWNGDSCGFIYDDENWAEIIEEPKVETKFEKGKWYKYGNWYIKFNTLDSSGIWLSSEQIDYDRNYNKREGRFGGKESYHKKILLTNLQEIQQYLPDGHPDLIKEEFVLPEYWFLRFKTKEVFDELCAKYAPDFVFFENAEIESTTPIYLGSFHLTSKSNLRDSSGV